MSKITREQCQQLYDAEMYETRDSFNRKLEEITGIQAKRYIGYQYYDAGGNYVGDSCDCDVRDILSNAYIEIGDE